MLKIHCSTDDGQLYPIFKALQHSVNTRVMTRGRSNNAMPR
jgi:hypothetical protein